MKKLIVLLIAAMLSVSVQATTKCTTGSGGFCCWDPDVDGPWPPITCD